MDRPLFQQVCDQDAIEIENEVSQRNSEDNVHPIFVDIKMECEDPVECSTSKGRIDVQKQDNDNPHKNIPSDASGERQRKEEMVSGVSCSKALGNHETLLPVHSLAEETVSTVNGRDPHPNVNSSKSLNRGASGEGSRKGIRMDGELFSCEDCGKTFASPSYLQLHMQIHAKERQFSCQVCGKSFQSQGNLQSHVVIHADKRLSPCAGSGKPLPKSNSPEENACVPTGEKCFTCANCGISFPNRSYLQSHLQLHSNENLLICQHCGLAFAVPSDLRKHLLIHSEPKQSSCQRTVPQKSDKQKIRTQVQMSRKLLSRSPQEGFYRKVNDPERHKQLRLQELLICTKCTRPFIKRSYVRTHQELQKENTSSCKIEKDAPIQCGACQRGVKSVSMVRSVYRRRVQPLISLNPFLCPICGRSFPKPTNFMRHLRIHKQGVC